ncbi:response regulator transcription factor [Mediterraneibacter glycyrrhizinilyticus]|nr:response regulator transcription factor [Mediterraneibacter glycyrrhizinilyticus]MBM6852817.1 response regulator transcription factor [Mediterraneibacter glycyrrhizinilyticus]
MHILIIEDDRELCQALTLQLAARSHTADCYHTGTEALYCAMKDSYDLILLDRMLPEIDGLSILRSLRRNKISVPVILTTALDAVSDRIDGLDAGADDYLVKPYDTEELLARIRVSHKDIVLDPDTRTLSLTVSSGKTSDQIQLSKREVLLMEFFLRNPEKTLNREQLFTRVWGPDGTVEDGNLDTYIYFCRKHLKNLKSRVQILTVHGTGYRME